MMIMLIAILLLILMLLLIRYYHLISFWIVLNSVIYVLRSRMFWLYCWPAKQLQRIYCP